MGLSDGERMEKLINATAGIIKLADGIKDNFHDPAYARLKLKCEDLWFELLQNESNGTFWIFGSDLGETKVNRSSIWGASLMSHIPQTEMEKERDVDDEKWSLADALIQGNILEHTSPYGKQLKFVHEIFLTTQFATYALCRYNDDFSNSLVNYNKAIRAIQGECFTIFSNDNNFARAWMLQHIFEKLYRPYVDDLVHSWWDKQNIHHAVLSGMKNLSYERVFTIFRNIQFENNISLTDRIVLTLEFCNIAFHYEHNQKELMQMIKGTGVISFLVEKEIAKCNEAYIHYESESRKEFSNNKDCDFTENYVDNEGVLHNYRY